MADNITTTENSPLRVDDITHRPKRYQHDNLIAAGRAITDEGDRAAPDIPMSSVPIQGVTIERAIQFYEQNARGEFQTLYKNTAKWLTQFLQSSFNGAQKATKSKSEVLNDEAEEIEQRDNDHP